MFNNIQTYNIQIVPLLIGYVLGLLVFVIGLFIFTQRKAHLRRILGVKWSDWLKAGSDVKNRNKE